MKHYRTVKAAHGPTASVPTAWTIPITVSHRIGASHNWPHEVLAQVFKFFTASVQMWFINQCVTELNTKSWAALHLFRLFQLYKTNHLLIYLGVGIEGQVISIAGGATSFFFAENKRLDTHRTCP